MLRKIMFISFYFNSRVVFEPFIQNINSIKNLNKIDSTAILILQNGKFFKGLGLGYQGTATGEVCFQYIYNWLSRNNIRPVLR